MPVNTFFYRMRLSMFGGGFTAVLGLIGGAVWAWALGADVLMVSLAAGAVGLVWGAWTVQKTPTGGVIIENKSDVNYVLMALYGWLTLLSFIPAVIIWGVLRLV